MSKTPVVLTITCTAYPSGQYVARVVGWGTPEHGGYGSLWARSIALEQTRESPSAAVLEGLAHALLSTLQARP